MYRSTFGEKLLIAVIIIFFIGVAFPQLTALLLGGGFYLVFSILGLLFLA